jgi:hypothetical protein
MRRFNEVHHRPVARRGQQNALLRVGGKSG